MTMAKQIKKLSDLVGLAVHCYPFQTDGRPFQPHDGTINIHVFSEEDVVVMEKSNLFGEPLAITRLEIVLRERGWHGTEIYNLTWNEIIEKLMVYNERLEAERAAQEMAKQSTDNANITSNISGRRWQDVKSEAERLVDKNGWPGLKKLTEKIGCNKRTLQKAIANSPKLTKAKSEHKTRHATPTAVSLTNEVLATHEEPSEQSPLSDIEVKELLQDLLKNIRANRPEMLENTRNEIDNMTADERRGLAEEYNRGGFKFDDPEKPRQYKEV